MEKYKSTPVILSLAAITFLTLIPYQGIRMFTGCYTYRSEFYIKAVIFLALVGCYFIFKELNKKDKF